MGQGDAARSTAFIITIIIDFLREERRLRVFENRVLRRVFRPKRDEVTGEWRK